MRNLEDDPERRRAARRVHSRIRDDEELVLLFGFNQMFLPVGTDGLGLRLSGGVVALTRWRILLEGPGLYSLPHPIVKQAAVRPRFLLSSTLAIDAGPMWGTLVLMGARRDLKALGKGINLFAGHQIPDQPATRLVPTVGLSSPRCAACDIEEDPMTLEYCHGCLRTIEWTDHRRALMSEYREFVRTRRPADLPPQHLRHWIREETEK